MENTEEVDFDNAAEGELDEQIESVDDATAIPKKDGENTEEDTSRKRKRDEKPSGNKRLKFSILESQEARQVEMRITFLLRKSENLRLKVDEIQGKLKKKLWTRFYDKFKLEVPELLELLGTKFTFEIVDGETFVVLNEQAFLPVFPPMNMMPPPFMFPYPNSPFPQPFLPPMGFPKPRNKMNSSMCEVCMIELSSDRVREAHFAGKKHKKNVARMEKHRKEAEDAKFTLFPAPFCRPAGMNVPNSGCYPYVCGLCNVPINSKKTEDLHLNGKKHKRKMLEKQNGGQKNKKPAKKNKSGFTPYTCGFCEAEITSAQMEEDHKKGKKHQRRVQAAMANPFPTMPPQQMLPTEVPAGKTDETE